MKVPAMRRGLVAANVGLLCGVGILALARGAQGQSPQPVNRARGEYTMVAGRTNLGGPAAVYIVDGTNQEMVALRWDQSKQVLVGVGYRNLAGDNRTQTGR